jgi:hypothetical protein
MKGSALVLALQDRFSVFWGVAGKGGCGRDSDRGRRILQPAASGERGAGLHPAAAFPGQEGEK